MQMMLSILGFGMVITFMYLIMSKRLSPLVALITIPILFALIGGFAAGIDDMMLEGIKKIAPTGVMLMFAILYFGVMIDAGLFDPLVRIILRFVKGDPMKIVLGTAILAMLISLDGDGSTTYMITVSAMLPLYQRLGMNALNMTCVTILAGGVMNLTPWGGPTARAATALHVDPADVFVPLIPSMVIACAGVLVLAWYLGMKERRRLGVVTLPQGGSWMDNSVSDDGNTLPTVEDAEDTKRPKLLWVNLGLTIALMTALILGVLPMPVLFMVGFAIALVINYPNLAEQRRREDQRDHRQHVAGMVDHAAGIFTGILNNTGMVEAMSHSFLAIIPDSWGPYLAVITALASMPFTFFMSNDAFYFGVLPILSEAAGNYGITPVEMARASLAGQPVHLLSPLVPSTYLLVGLAKVEFADHQKFTLKWAIAISMLLMFGGLLFGLYPLAS
jgi:CitMHS family citrate-Mg2+:H+ or citrate-Ca2+:H+ symporter